MRILFFLVLVQFFTCHTYGQPDQYPLVLPVQLSVDFTQLTDSLQLGEKYPDHNGWLSFPAYTADIQPREVPVITWVSKYLVPRHIFSTTSPVDSSHDKPLLPVIPIHCPSHSSLLPHALLFLQRFSPTKDSPLATPVVKTTPLVEARVRF